MSLVAQRAASAAAAEFPFQLPVSRRVVRFSRPTGANDLLLLSAAGSDTALGVELAASLARNVNGQDLDWSRMPVTDLDAFLLRLRQVWIGDHVRSDVRCTGPDCGERIDIAFTVSQFLLHHWPSDRLPAGRDWRLGPADEPDWYRLSHDSGTPSVEFRLPTPADQLEVLGFRDADEELAKRCLRPGGIPTRLRRRVEAVMEAMAPSLFVDLQGVCPACGAMVTVLFDARAYCLRELRHRATFLYEDVDVLARRYHWSERDILSLPYTRRVAYVELARNAEAV